MAYNPFNIFRRNQKALFAVLTVFIMIMFTLSFGAGDFFERVPRWLGSSRGEAVCKIDGHTVTTGELEGPRGTQFNRVMANRFMSLAADEITRTLENYILEQQPRLGPEGKDTVNQALETISMMRRPQFAMLVIQELPLLAASMNQRIESPTARSEDKEVAHQVQVMYQLYYKLAVGGGTHYFLNAPNRTRRDLIEFKLWEKKADQLGIKFNRDDVKKLIQNEFFGFFKSDVRVREAMKQTPGFTMEVCLDALAAEFRVRAAQTAVMGQFSRYGRAPAYPTPFETFEYYRDQCSPATYEVIPVPASGFVDKVPGEPTDAEVSDLFKKYGDSEPNPRSETPGFKTPRKISVAWLGITGDEPYYTKLAEEQIKVGETMAKASGLLTVPLPGATATWAAGAVAPMTIKEPAVDAAYNTFTSQFKFQLRNEYSSSSLYVRDLLPSSVVKPGVLASTLGGFVGQTAGYGNPVAAVSISLGAPIGYELRDRVKVGVPVFLGLTPGPGMLPTAVGGAAAGQFHEPKALPIDYMRPELLKTAIEARAKVLAFGSPGVGFGGPTEKGDIARFSEELSRRETVGFLTLVAESDINPARVRKLLEDGRPKDKATVEKYIQDFITSRGIKHVGKSVEARDEWTLEDDPGLLPLVIAQKESLRQARGFHGNEYMPFGQSFFWTRVFDQNTFRMRRGPATSGLYQAQTYPPGDPTSRDDGKPHYVVWRTEDTPAQKNNIITARPAIVAAWKRLKARELAQARANQLAEAIRANPATNEFAISQFLHDKAFELQAGITDPKARQRARLFPINNVAPLVPSGMGGMMPGMGMGQLERFSLKESENLPYPTPEMQTALLDNRDKAPKTVVVLPDAPKDTFYVATLVHRDMRTADDFRFNVYSRFGNARIVLDLFHGEVNNKARESIVELLKKEFKYEETEEQKKKLDENVKSGGRGGD